LGCSKDREFETMEAAFDADVDRDLKKGILESMFF
jgi:hypothetical protein